MNLSIVILTWNSEKYIERCIDSILSSLSESNLDSEIYVVDNGSIDRTVTILHGIATKLPYQLHIICLPRNLGTTVPRNIALSKTRGDYVCIIDSDVEVHKGIFAALIKLLDNDKTIGLAVPKIYYPSGKLQKSHDCFPTLLHKIRRYFCLRSMEAHEEAVVTISNEVKNVDYAISAFWLFRRALIDKIGLLDEKIFYSPEDVDYCLRVWKSGYRIVYVPTVSIVHHTQEISRGWKLNRAKISHLRGLVYLLVKHRYFLAAPKFALTDQAGKQDMS